MSVEKPCSEALSYPLQCFQEMFLATPAVVGTFFVGIGGFAIAVLIWGAIFGLALLAVYFLLKNLYKASRYFFTQTKVGQKVAAVVPVGRVIQKLCSRNSQDVPAKKLINTQAIGDYSANIVSKVHVDSKWFKSALKHVPFTKQTSDLNSSNSKSPSKTPQRSTSRISSLTPKLLSPKSHKQQ